jgi:hypothetical protein
VVGTRNKPKRRGCAAGLESGQPNVFGNSNRRHHVVYAPHQGDGHVALRKRFEEDNFKLLAFIEILDGVRDNLDAILPGKVVGESSRSRMRIDEIVRIFLQV